MDIRYGVLNNFIGKGDSGKFFYKWENIMEVPEFQTLMETEQSSKWHREGNVWVHTGLVCEAALSMLEKREYGEDDSVVFLAAALFHDIGKGSCTRTGKDGEPHSYGHDLFGSRMTRFILWDMDISLRERICLLVRYHMSPLTVFSEKNYISSIMGIVGSGVDYCILSDLKRCDNAGSIMYDGYDKMSDESRIGYFETCCRALYPVTRCLGRDGAFPWEWGSPQIFGDRAIMIIGIPGAGKDTFIDRYLSGDQYVRISRDDIRVELGVMQAGEKKTGTDEEERQVTEIERRRINEALDNREIPVIDATNLSRKTRDSVKNMVSAKDWSGERRPKTSWRYIYIEPDSKEECLSRRDGEIGRNVISGMMKSIDFPERHEYDEFAIYRSGKNNFEKIDG